MILNLFLIDFNPILLMSLLPILGILLLLILPENNLTLLRIVTLVITSGVFLISLMLWLLFHTKTSFFQYSVTLFWLPYFHLYYTVGVDGISLFFIILTTFLIFICILNSWSSIYQSVKEYFICFLFLEFCLIQAFCVLDLILFYIFFESVLIPMFLIIGIWGSRIRKIRAAFQFFMYTLIGSFFMLSGLIYLYVNYGTTDFQTLNSFFFSNIEQVVLWVTFFMSFAVKIPMIPFHIWLPEAHAEAPTNGSVILAGVLLKLGGYGFLRFSLSLFPQASIYFTPFIFVLSIIAIIYGSVTTLRQIDFKKIIAYSSISHMGFVTLGIFSLNLQGIEGSIALMLSHGLVSSALFICVGILYDRYKTRIVKYYNGLTTTMPIFVVLFAFFSFANIGFPGTSSFIGEFLVLSGIFQTSIVATLIGSLGVILSASYSIWLVNRIGFGMLKIYYFNSFQDIARREFIILFILFVLVIWMGFYPISFLREMHVSVLNLLEHF